jgi:hypothetical protein
LGVLVVLLAGILGSARAEEPAKKAPPTEPSPQQQFEGLGFSTAPKEGGKARVGLFGLVGEGYKFVYVFDRSGSMGGEGRNALRAVKAELIQSLSTLDTVHQFQIVFYNENAKLFNPSGQPGHLAFATDQNKRQAARFMESIHAEGGTDHEKALRLAAHLHPDVIFFMTDGDDPQLTPAELERIRRLAAGTIINAIRFGTGPKPAEGGWLEELAHQNGGSYVYVDISKYEAENAAKPGR